MPGFPSSPPSIRKVEFILSCKNRHLLKGEGGSTDIMVNQQQPSGGWALLGAFAMAPGQSHGVDVYGALEGETVGDAVLVVPS